MYWVYRLGGEQKRVIETLSVLISVVKGTLDEQAADVNEVAATASTTDATPAAAAASSAAATLLLLLIHCCCC